eukprot:TRINITY_DN10584_c0_g2_i2.p1 TRINITY_DN10584_c0_g2~~TRINITY_DN10584_c0_g2_i2.p1  ORF type:complete len:193 (-),score=11.98 TRINITY_DN10584_c0_g2_i2:140-718(-)
MCIRDSQWPDVPELARENLIMSEFAKFRDYCVRSFPRLNMEIANLNTLPLNYHPRLNEKAMKGKEEEGEGEAAAQANESRIVEQKSQVEHKSRGGTPNEQRSRIEHRSRGDMGVQPDSYTQPGIRTQAEQRSLIFDRLAEHQISRPPSQRPSGRGEARSGGGYYDGGDEQQCVISQFYNSPSRYVFRVIQLC